MEGAARIRMDFDVWHSNCKLDISKSSTTNSARCSKEMFFTLQCFTEKQSFYSFVVYTVCCVNIGILLIKRIVCYIQNTFAFMDVFVLCATSATYQRVILEEQVLWLQVTMCNI